MKIAFFSNFLNLHQLPICQEFLKYPDIEFTFVACTPVPQERIEMNYEDMNEKYDFVLCSYKDAASYRSAMELAKNADVAIFGSTDLSFLYERMALNRLTFRYCERALRKGSWRRFIPTTFFKIYREYLRYRSKNLFILSASSFTSHDLSLCGFKVDKCYKWGYLPEVKPYDHIDTIIDSKVKNRIIWVGRFIDCKHPEFAIEAAKILNEKGMDFELQFIGNGKRLEASKKLVQKYNLSKCIKFYGALKTSEVRLMMEQASIFIFNSDRYEGWGAVVNEAMNAACAPVVSDAVGSASFLIKNGENGFSYEYGNLQAFVEILTNLLNNSQRVKLIGRRAYSTMVDIWNPEIAVTRFINIVRGLMNGDKMESYSDGPCSKASIINN